ncbi:ethanolamine ammonia-lyase subunit EutC [Desulfosediminicola ganghwensis]|uniref:ethanolamine ammonia-lyase subunit EutC n=1 Tax=Desulfosediminicola ganghwensis TaxID=2569540 RepID=UPI0010ABB6DF|nr:ethanolamine ammonia-lyase subunit EutC [Desulfosediminicola ganghwensis]
MNNDSTGKPIITSDPWSKLRTFTDARIALGRCGTSLPVKESLEFKLAHARARDAVLVPADMVSLANQLELQGYSTIQLESSVVDRMEYLVRPDKGRLLSETSSIALQHHGQRNFDIGITVCDGLSGPAIHENAYEGVSGFLECVAKTELRVAPVCLVTNGRVAIGDEIGHLLGCKMMILLVGERPGLSSSNSLGAYITYEPKPGITDEARNCISNIRTGGMSIAEGVRKITYLVESGLALGKTGVELKDKMSSSYLPLQGLIPSL